MSTTTYSTAGYSLVRLHLRGGTKPQGVETIPVCNFEPHVLSRRTVGGLSLVTIEGQQCTPCGLRTWQHEVPERLLQSPLGLHRALSGAMGATGIIWASQSGHLARFLAAELELLAAST